MAERKLFDDGTRVNGCAANHDYPLEVRLTHYSMKGGHFLRGNAHRVELQQLGRRSMRRVSSDGKR